MTRWVMSLATIALVIGAVALLRTPADAQADNHQCTDEICWHIVGCEPRLSLTFNAGITAIRWREYVEPYTTAWDTSRDDMAFKDLDDNTTLLTFGDNSSQYKEIDAEPRPTNGSDWHFQLQRNVGGSLVWNENLLVRCIETQVYPTSYYKTAAPTPTSGTAPVSDPQCQEWREAVKNGTDLELHMSGGYGVNGLACANPPQPAEVTPSYPSNCKLDAHGLPLLQDQLIQVGEKAVYGRAGINGVPMGSHKRGDLIVIEMKPVYQVNPRPTCR